MFMDRARVGAFAITADEYVTGAPGALFRILVACAMFQRRQDQQILRVLQNMDTTHARELTNLGRLVTLAERSPCGLMGGTQTLREDCDLAKDARGQGCCAEAPGVACHLKRHTVVMRRYGHFGKVPTSIALAVREAGAKDLHELYESVLASRRGRRDRALALEAALSRAWRVNQKIAAMFLSTISNPDLARAAGVRAAPWSRGIDWTYFVVIDSNVDLFLSSIGYAGSGSYDARRDFVCELARGVHLRELDRRVRDYNPRLVQQALYLFMSSSNRRTATTDCMQLGATTCARCPNALSSRCPVRQAN